MNAKIVAVLWLVVMALVPSQGSAEVVEEYWPNGQVRWEHTYQDGVRNGISREYGEDGTLLAEENYEHGKKNGISRVYYGDGTLRMETHYQDGLKNGLETTYLRWDNKKTETLFEQGQATTTKRYDEHERLRDELIFTYGEQGTWTVRQILYDEKGEVILDQEL